MKNHTEKYKPILKTLLYSICFFMIFAIGQNVSAKGTDAEDATLKNVFSYYVDEETGCLTITGDGKLSNIHVTEKKNKVKFISVRPWGKTEKQAKKITSIVIGDGITDIPDGAFANLTNLQKISIADTVTEIGKYVFYQCKSLKKIVIPDSVKKIGKESFYGCRALSSVKMGSGMKSLGSRVFYGCTSLCEMKVATRNKNFIMKNDALYSKSKKTLYQYLTRVSGNAKINQETTCIKDGAFAFANCTKVSIPSKTVTIEKEAFYNCSKLNKVSISKKVNRIGDRAFFHCKKLKTLKIDKNVKKIGSKAFGFYMKQSPKKGIKKVPKFKMIVKKGSNAQKYAKQNKIKYCIS